MPDYALSIKKSEVKNTTYKDYLSRINRFKEFLGNRNKLEGNINEVTKRDVSQYLNTFEGAKNRNNAKIALNSIFNILSDESYIDFNFVREIRNKKIVQKQIKNIQLKKLRK